VNASWFLALAVLLAAPGAWAHDHAQHAGHAASAPAAAEPMGVRVKLEDTLLRDQDGREVHLLSEVLGGRVAVVNFVYTTCTTVCPVSSASFGELQKRLSGRLGRDVLLVSITVDPQRDTPARLKEYAAKYGAGEGWRWLTGKKRSVDRVLQAFGAYTTNFEDHPAMIMVGRGGRWIRLFGFPSADELLAQTERALDAHTAHHQ